MSAIENMSLDVGEYEADYVTACAAAFWRMAFHQRSRRWLDDVRHAWSGNYRETDRERGWL